MHHESLSWEGTAYHHFDKSSDWYWSVGIIVGSVVILCILFNNILFGVFILLAGITAIMYASREPEILTIELRPRGIRIDDTMYHYESLDSFWIQEESHFPKILVKSKKLLMPYIIIPLGDMHHEDVRAFLLMHLKETHHDETVVHKLLEYFGF